MLIYNITSTHVCCNYICIDGFTPPFRLDWDNNWGGIMLFVREDTPYKLLPVENHPMEGFYVEINLRKPNGWFVAVTVQIDAKLVLTSKN